MKIRRGDSVVINAGNDSGSAPHRVIQVMDGGKRLVVQGVNNVYKHVRRGHPKSPSGGRLELEMPIDSSNCMFYCDSCSKGVRLGFRYKDDGSKERFCRSCGASVGGVSPAKASYAKK